MLVNNAKPHLENATIVVDKLGNRDFRKELAVYLQRKINTKGGTKHVKKVKMEDSRSNNLLQLADMICGAVARSFCSDKSDRMIYRRVISHREMHIQVWPNN